MSRGVRLFGSVVLIGVVVLVVVLSWQVREARAELASTRERLRVVAVGDLVPPMDAITMDGRVVRVGVGDSVALQVLFVFNTSCPYCIENLPRWRALAGQLADLDIPVVGWSHDPDSLAGPYVAEHSLQYPVVTPGPRWRQHYKVGRVPTTLVVSASGRVRYARAGVLSEGAVDSLLAVVRGDSVGVLVRGN
ncbi:MAG: TlpA disulfide reductase family protein [Gemmatimonadales bacterium]